MQKVRLFKIRSWASKMNRFRFRFRLSSFLLLLSRYFDKKGFFFHNIKYASSSGFLGSERLDSIRFRNQYEIICLSPIKIRANKKKFPVTRLLLVYCWGSVYPLIELEYLKRYFAWWIKTIDKPDACFSSKYRAVKFTSIKRKKKIIKPRTRFHCGRKKKKKINFYD